MPRKKQETEELENKETISIKKSTTKKASTKTTKIPTEKETTKTRKSLEKQSNTKKTTTKSKKTTTKKTTTNKKSKTSQTKSTKQITNLEYYDLPYNYNKTIIKILSQTPKTLFLYWEISDEDRKNFENQYGKNFFQETKPVLIIHNKTLNYKFEVEINDFANSWYLHVENSNCEYQIELGRRPINKKINTDYIYITTSNQIETSNDKILFDKNQKMVYFRNIKTKIESSKPLKTISLLKNMGKIYDIYDLYKVIYQKENIEQLYDLSNPSSQSSSSQFK